MIPYRILEIPVLEQPMSPEALARLRAQIAQATPEAIVRMTGVCLTVEVPGT